LAAGIGNLNSTTSAETACLLALDLLNQAKSLSVQLGRAFNVRIGICTGPVVAGVIGQSKFAFDAWGDTVNVSSRMETSCGDGKIQVSQTTFEKTKEVFIYDSRGEIAVKGKGNMETYYLVRKRPRVLSELAPKKIETTNL
jgi:adenylate cyclase